MPSSATLFLAIKTNNLYATVRFYAEVVGLALAVVCFTVQAVSSLRSRLKLPRRAGPSPI
jgi:hypothetical protein